MMTREPTPFPHSPPRVAIDEISLLLFMVLLSREQDFLKSRVCIRELECPTCFSATGNNIDMIC
jgi:hypothetical protein